MFIWAFQLILWSTVIPSNEKLSTDSSRLPLNEYSIDMELMGWRWCGLKLINFVLEKIICRLWSDSQVVMSVSSKSICFLKLKSFLQVIHHQQIMWKGRPVLLVNHSCTAKSIHSRTLRWRMDCVTISSRDLILRILPMQSRNGPPQHCKRFAK